MRCQTSQYSLCISVPPFYFLYGQLFTFYMVNFLLFIWSTFYFLYGQLEFLCGQLFTFDKINFNFYMVNSTFCMVSAKT